jgi:autotransporter adhesin
MKKLLTLLILLPLISFSQEKNYLVENGQYYFTKSLNATDSDERITTSLNGSLEIKRKHIVQIVNYDSKTVSYRYLTFTDDKLKKLYNEDNETLKMSIEDFSFYTNKYLSRFREWKVGAYTVPIRIRSKNENFEFESNLSLGANIAKGVNFSRYGDLGYAEISFGISLTKVNLTEDNSDIKTVNPDLNTLSQSALTTSFGIAIHLAKNVNFGLFYGWDFLEGSDQEKLKWIHNKKPWLGFGINVSFNSNDSSNTSGKTEQ